MQRSNKTLDTDEIRGLLNLRVTYKKAPIDVLEALCFDDIKTSSRDVRDFEGVDGCLIIQTCNRVEIFLSLSSECVDCIQEEVINYWCENTGFDQSVLRNHLEISQATDALVHLMRMTSGLESMVVGEDQILGQVQDAFAQSKEYGTLGSKLSKIFEKAVKVGRVVRVKTGLNKGAVSIGSIAVNLLEEKAGGLEGKKVLIVGAGRIGELAGKALAARKTTLIFVANRTYEKAVALSKILNGEAVNYNKLVEKLSTVDIVIVATAAALCIITKSKMEEALMIRRKGRSLLIIDLSQPRNVDEQVSSLENITVHNIDNLRGIADDNLKKRLQESDKAETLIQNEIDRIKAMQKKLDVGPIINEVSRRADEIRRKELERAYSLMDKTNVEVERCGHCRKVMERFSKQLMRRKRLDPINNLMNAELDRDFEKIAIIQEVFKARTPDLID